MEYRLQDNGKSHLFNRKNSINLGKTENPGPAGAGPGRDGSGTGWLGWMQLPYDQEEVVSHIERVAKSVREQFDTFVVLGIGTATSGLFRVIDAIEGR